QADAQRAHIWKDEPPGERRPDGFARSLALLIGIDDYSNGLPKLTTAVNDARALADILHSEHGYYVHHLLEEVTRIQLEEFFDQTLPQKVNEHDRLLIYFAGHGLIAQEGEDGPGGYLLPQDARPESTATFLSFRDLNGWLNQLACRHLFLVLDCAFAGEPHYLGRHTPVPAPNPLYREQ
ncbi:MAG TPA: caspase family protein, partial [Caldilineaceae bacterium]|nr:caspase family protein [Caldilineaceae bacterium]